MYNYLLRKPGAVEKALKIGLIGKNDYGSYYDRFAGRIIFPIFSTNGRVVAFAGRILEKAENTGKYVNSPESVIYSKSKVLYGLSHGKEEIRRSGHALVVEGYMDLISLNQNGIKNVIAVSGTALTDGQALLLSRYTKDVILLFDSDTAGVKASVRSVEILLKKSLNIKIASLPAGEDPDSYINAHSKDDFLHQMQSAVNFLEYQAKYYEDNGSLKDPMQSAGVIRELLRPLALIDDEIKQSRLISMLAERFKLSERLLQDELQIVLRKTESAPEHAREFNREQVKEAKPAAKRRNQFEIYLIKTLLEGEPEIISYVQRHIDIDEVQDERHRTIVQELFTLNDTDQDVGLSSLVNMLTEPEIVEYVTGLALDEYS
ncbi:MAG: toprim domain-containing protein, partial [Ignavibacteriales bacterium]|nr:toprim domain-containing protein [Ignavibacteriales bacterium]